jgi:tetratricopeptide (TPR) repeat protein
MSKRKNKTKGRSRKVANLQQPAPIPPRSPAVPTSQQPPLWEEIKLYIPFLATVLIATGGWLDLYNNAVTIPDWLTIVIACGTIGYCLLLFFTKKLDKRITLAGVMVLLALLIPKGISKWNELSVKLKPSPAEIFEEILAYSDKVHFQMNDPSDRAQSQENQCRNISSTVDAMKCWVLAGDFYKMSNRYRKTFECFRLAYDMQPRIADPLYARGDAYYTLSLLDMARKRRFQINLDELTCIFQPDEQSEALLKMALNEYQQAEKLPTVKDLNPLEPNYTLIHLVGYRKEQINSHFDASSSIKLHKAEYVELMPLLPTVADNETLLDQVMTYTGKSMEYQKSHPEEFPHLFQPDFWENLSKKMKGLDKKEP